MSKQPYENLASQAERRATLRNEQRVHASTYVDHVHDDLSGGRFAKEFPTEKLGVTPVPQYPKGANWSQDQLPDEAPLGVAIDEMVPVGEPHEVASSLRDANDGAGFSPPSAADSASPDEVSRPAESLTLPPAGAPSSPKQKRKRR